MPEPKNWKRHAVEIVVIVGSILLAFGIEAWWDRREEQAQREELLTALRADFVATSTALERAIDDGRADVRLTRSFLEVVAEERSVSRDSLLVLFGGIREAVFFQPTVASYRGAVSNGSFELVRSATLVGALTDFDMQLGLYELHLGISGDLFYLGAVQDLRRAVGSMNGPRAEQGSVYRSLVPADFDLRGRLAVATVEPVAIVQGNLLRNLVAMDQAVERILVELDRLLS